MSYKSQKGYIFNITSLTVEYIKTYIVKYKNNNTFFY